MNLFEKLERQFTLFLNEKLSFNPNLIKPGFFEINIDESKKDFGDINSNAALMLAQQTSQNPRVLAEKICSNFKSDLVEKTEIAGPGFINIFLTKAAFKELAQQVLIQDSSFYKSDLEKQKSYNIEFVSANPTGPLHIGNGRGGVIGDVLGNILEFLGHKVTKEFYINDTGIQIKNLGLSLKARCLQELGQPAEIPENGYQGEYLVNLAKECVSDNKDIIKESDQFFANLAIKKMLEMIKETLKDFGVNFDIWFSEESLHKDGSIEEAIKTLSANGYTYEYEGATWFKSTEFGDDKDRVIKKSDGTYAYLGPDIAYLLSKVSRGANHMIMILGQDHHSYLTRINAIHQALGLKTSTDLNVILYQLVHLKNAGEILKMSKRAGNLVTLNEIIETVGKDVAKFFFLNRKADAQLDFDLELALKQTDENPVFYIQYAYVRTNSILAKTEEVEDFKNVSENDLNNLNHDETYLIKKIVHLKVLLKNISVNLHTHLLPYYLFDIAKSFHQYYSKNKVLDASDKQTSRSRIALVKILNGNFNLCLKLLGLDQPQKM